MAGSPTALAEASAPEGAAVACRSVSSGYLGSRVLRKVSFSIDRPAIYVVLGPNGAGKTTLFRTLAGILQPYEGTVTIAGAPMPSPGSQDHLHYLSHMDGIPDGLRVREALEYYARVERASSDDIDRALDLLEIRPLARKFLSELSAGQRKRVSIARIFLRERSIYLLDEPTANLDPKLARETRELILKLSREKVVLYSSHNLFEAREIGEYVLLLKEGQVTLFDRLENLRAARYMVGIRLLAPSDAMAEFERRGNFYIRELSGPEAVPKLIRDLEARGVQLREVREMDNPLEDLFQ